MPRCCCCCCVIQVFAAARATDVVDSQWINTELTQMRISGHGVVSLSAYAGVCLDNAEQPELQTDDGLRQFMASVMMALRDLENVVSSSSSNASIMKQSSNALDGSQEKQ